MGLITRVFEFDSAHRVMNERVKCFNIHGHRFKVELTFRYEDCPAIGYAIDFKEIKRLCGTWFDEKFDHAIILNPKDTALIDFVRANGYRLYVMGLGNDADINPSAENLAYEIFSAMRRMFSSSRHGVVIEQVRLFETPNCWVDFRVLDRSPYVPAESFSEEFNAWRERMGNMSYDVREIDHA